MALFHDNELEQRILQRGSRFFVQVVTKSIVLPSDIWLPKGGGQRGANSNTIWSPQALH